MRLLLVRSFLLAISIVHAAVAVNVYGPHVQRPSRTMTVASAPYTSATSHNNVFLASPLHDPLPSTSFHVKLETGAVPGLSIPQQGSFFGFSIELGFVSQAFGLDSTLVPFLNLMTNIRQHAGSVHMRVGGNTGGYGGSANPADTPPLIFTSEVIKIMAQISSLANVRWYLYAPSNDIQNIRLQIAEDGESILWNYLAGLHTVNEPNVHSQHDHQLTNVFRQRVQSYAHSNTPATELVDPSLDEVWKHEAARSTGFVTDLEHNLVALTVERHPTDDCDAQHGMDTSCTTQELFPSTHQYAKQTVSKYLDSAAYAQRAGLSYVMLETNMVSCGGFPFLSNSIATALWAIDYGLQMAYANFTRAMLHVGGDSDYHSPFVPPATSQSTPHQWSIGPVYYSTLFVAEALGSRQPQVLDLRMNNDDDFTPGYAIYENGQPTRVVLINFLGARDYTASISIGGMVPSQVKVKYLLASSITEKHNITWAGQTFGDALGSDGRPVGVVDIQTIDCDQSNNICNVTVPASGAALVFLSLVQEFIEPDPNVTFALPHALPTISALIAVCTFVCLESLLSYAVTSTIPFASVVNKTKNAR